MLILAFAGHTGIIVSSGSNVIVLAIALDKPVLKIKLLTLYLTSRLNKYICCRYSLLEPDLASLMIPRTDTSNYYPLYMLVFFCGEIIYTCRIHHIIWEKRKIFVSKHNTTDRDRMHLRKLFSFI